jgi:hypothetical protein
MSFDYDVHEGLKKMSCLYANVQTGSYADAETQSCILLICTSIWAFEKVDPG